MTINDVRGLARLLTYTDTINLSNTDALKYLNIVYKDIENKIVSKVNEDFFYEEWTFDLVDGQSEYSFPSLGVAPGLKKLLGVRIKYKQSDITYKECTLQRYGQLSNTPEYLEQNQPQQNPLVVIADESMFIMPVSTDNIINGGKIQGIRELTELLEADASSTTTIKIPVSYHDLISIGMKQYIFASRGQVDMQNASKTEYDTAVQSMIEELSDRYISAVRTNLPTLTYLQ